MENTALSLIMTKHNIKKITTMYDLKKHFNLDELDEEKTPKITTEVKTLIFTDNVDFNETYLIDLIDEVLDKRRNVAESVKVFYIDNVLLRSKLQASKLQIIPMESVASESISADKYSVTNTETGKTTSNMSITDIERTYLPPMILTINPISNELSQFTENPLKIFVVADIEKILIVSNLDE